MPKEHFVENGARIVSGQAGVTSDVSVELEGFDEVGRSEVLGVGEIRFEVFVLNFVNAFKALSKVFFEKNFDADDIDGEQGEKSRRKIKRRLEIGT